MKSPISNGPPMITSAQTQPSYIASPSLERPAVTQPYLFLKG